LLFGRLDRPALGRERAQPVGHLFFFGLERRRLLLARQLGFLVDWLP
jgi:hypothetical protein